jgi:glycosyltransferase involved in cell wall biosynthesis
VTARILAVSTAYPPDVLGGAEATVREYCTRLAAVGHDVRVLALTPGSHKRTSLDEGVTVVRMPSRAYNNYWPYDLGASRSSVAKAAWHLRDLWSRRAVRDVADEISRFEPDVVLLNGLAGWSLAPLTAVASADAGSALVLHDYGYACIRRTIDSDGRSCASPCASCRPRVAMSDRLAKVDVVLPVSEALLDGYRRLGLFKGVRHRVFHPPVSQSPLPTSREWPFGYLGRLHPSKGVEDLLEAARRADQRVLVAGSGDAGYERELRGKYYAVAEWLGWVPPAELLTRIGTLVVPSRSDEAFGRVVVEAALAGRDVIVSDRPGLLEAATSTGVPCRSYPTGDAAALAIRLTEPVPERSGSAQAPTMDPLLQTIDELVFGRPRSGRT